MQKQVAHKQSLFDFAIQHCGTVNAVHEISKANGISPTAELTVGTLLTIPDGTTTEPDIVDFYSNNNIVPATALTENDNLLTAPPLGIGFMSIGATFKVS